MVYTATSKSSYKKHQYSGKRKNLKRVRGGLRRFYPEESRLKVWRAEKTLEKPVDEEIGIDDSITQNTQPATAAAAQAGSELPAEAVTSTSSGIASPGKLPRTKERKQKPAVEKPSTVNGKEKGKSTRATNKRTLRTYPPRRDHKRPRLAPEEVKPEKTFPQAFAPELHAAITCARTGHIGLEVAEKLHQEIQRTILREALTTEPGTGPRFRGKPQVTSEAVKLWCADDRSFQWLEETVSGIKLPSHPDGFTVVRQRDLPRRVRASLVIPDPCGLIEHRGLIGRGLSSQNTRIDLSRWLLVKALKQDLKWFVLVDIPEDQVGAILEADRELSFLTGSVYVRFQMANGRFSEIPPGWDPIAQTIRRESEKLMQPTDPASAEHESSEETEPEDPQAVAEGFTGLGVKTLKLEGEDSNDVVSLISTP